MKYCPSCREQSPDDSAFCADDGTRLEPVQPAAAAESGTARHCGECGEAVEPDGAFCPECGTPYEDRNDTIPPQPKTEPLSASVQKEGDERDFGHLAEAAIKGVFPDAWIGRDVQVGSKEGRPLKTDLLVVDSGGILLIDCKDYPGRIRGSAAYDYAKGELWTSQSPTGAIVEIKSRGKNPAQEASDKLSAFRDSTAGARLRKEQLQTHSVLLFPDAADLSGIAGLPVSPGSLAAHPVTALTLAGLPSCKDKQQSPINRQAVLQIIEAIKAPKETPAETRPGSKERESPTEPPPNFSFAEEEPIRETPIHAIPERAARQERRKGNGRLYVLGGAIGAGLVFLLVFAYFIPWRTPDPALTGPVQKEDVLGSIPPPGPSGAEVSPPNPLSPSEPSPPQSAQPAGPHQPLPVPQGPDTMVTGASRSPTETGRRTEGGSANQPQESAVKRAPEPAGQGLATQGEKILPKKDPAVREELAGKTAGSDRISRRPADAGTYETIKPTAARATPSDSAEIVDEINRGLRLNVSGSQGDWLVVHSKKRNSTVYVKRDDAMLIRESSKSANSELKWKEVERQIQQALTQRGVSGVTVSFIADTAYLRGTVPTEEQRFSAELAARTIPDVIHIHNGIWVGR